MANRVTYILELRDRYTRVAKKVQQANFKLAQGLNRVKHNSKTTGLEVVTLAKKLDFQLSVALNRVRHKAMLAATAFKGLEGGFSRVRNMGAGMTVALSLPIALLGRSMIKAASDAEETQAKFDTTFGDIKQGAAEVAIELRRSYGLATDEAQSLMAATGDLLSGFGFQGKMKLELSERVQKLAVDLASFTNLQGGAKQASDALTKGLLGERESMKTLGIAILEADVKAKVIEMHKAGQLQGITTMRQAKAFATLELAVQQSANAIGDFQRTNTSHANQMKIMNAEIRDASVAMGVLLIPMATKAAKAIADMARWMNKLSPGRKQMILLAGVFLLVLGPLLLIVGGVAVLAAGLVAVGAPIATMIAGIVAIASVMTFAFSAMMNWASFIDIIVVVVDGIKGIGNALMLWIADPMDYVMGKLNAFIKTFKAGTDLVRGFLQGEDKTTTTSRAAGRGRGRGAPVKTSEDSAALAASRGLHNVVDINLNAPKGTVKSVKETTPATSTPQQVNVGINNVGAQ